MDGYDLNQVRLYINDKDKKTFSDEELESILNQAGCIWCAISELWTIKATQADTSGGGGYSVGLEEYKEPSMKDNLSLALGLADKFKARCTCGDNKNRAHAICVNPQIPGVEVW